MKRFLPPLIVLLAWFFAAPSLAHATAVQTIGAQGKQPRIAIDESEVIHVVYGASDSIFYQSSQDHGKTFSSPQQIGSLDSQRPAMRRGPRIAVSGDNIVITAIGGTSKDLKAWYSADHGQSWKGPVTITDQKDAAHEGLHALAAGPQGSFVSVWLDLRTPGMKLFGSQSNDGGATWSKNTLVYASPSGTVCQCCHPSVVVDSTGKIVVMWRNELKGPRDMYIASSTTGMNFGNAIKLGEGTWNIKTCPMDGGAIALDDSGNVRTAWRRNKEVFLCSPTQPETKLGSGANPTITVCGGKNYILWQEKGEIVLSSPSEKAVSLGKGAYADIASSRKGLVAAVWESTEGACFSLLNSGKE